MRKHLIENEELKVLLSEKDEHIKHARAISSQIDDLQKQIDELEEERNKAGLLVQQVKDKIFPIMDTISIEKEEFEYEAQLLLEDGQVIMQIGDALEEWKERFLKMKYDKQAKESDLSQNATQSNENIFGEAVPAGEQQDNGDSHEGNGAGEEGKATEQA